MPETLPKPEKDRSHWTVKKFDTIDEMRTYHVKNWQKAGAAARHKAAWELVTDYWIGKKGMKPDELRLQRSVTSFTRGGS